MMTSAVHISIQLTSPLLGVGAGAAAAGLASGAGFAASTAGLSGAAAGLSCASVTPANARHSVIASQVVNRFMQFSLQRRRIGLAGADANDFFQVEDEDLSVADLAGIGGLLDGLDRLLEHLALHRGLELHLGQEIDDILGAAVQLGVALLPAKALHLRHRDSLHADRRERLAHLVELERLDDCGYQFHGVSWADALRARPLRSRFRTSC